MSLIQGGDIFEVAVIMADKILQEGGGAILQEGGGAILAEGGASVALSGTLASGAVEGDIVTGGKTIILTVSNDTLVAAGGTFDAERQNIIDGLLSAQSETNGWNAVVRATLGVAAVVRTSATVITITLPPFAPYDITAPETITATVPSTALVGGNALVASPTFDITQAGGATVPDAPTIGAATENGSHNGTVDIAFTPGSDGGAAVDLATATGSLGDVGTSSGGSPINVAIAAARKGINQTWTVTQHNSVGTSAASAASNTVAATTVPGVPTSVVNTPGDTTVSVNATAPADTGGLSLTYVADDGTGGHVTAAGALPRTVTGLTNGVSVTPRVKARNSLGDSAFVSGGAVTPEPGASVPDAPTIGAVFAGYKIASVGFTPPVFDGGTPIIDYEAISSPGGITGIGTVSPISVSGLTNETAYTFTVRARNAIGFSDPSAASDPPVTPTTPAGQLPDHPWYRIRTDA